MVRLKIAYWEIDFEAVCPTLDHDLLSQAHIYNFFIVVEDKHASNLRNAFNMIILS